MSKTLSFSKDRARVLVSAELDSVVGGVGFANPTATAVTRHHVSSKKPIDISSKKPVDVSSKAPISAFITPEIGLWG